MDNNPRKEVVEENIRNYLIFKDWIKERDKLTRIDTIIGIRKQKALKRDEYKCCVCDKNIVEIGKEKVIVKIKNELVE